jgi:hypothetical protein
MKITLTKKQYKELLRLVYMGNWVANSPRLADTIDVFDEVESHIFSYVDECGLEDWAEVDEESDMMSPSSEFEQDSGVFELIGEYNNDNLWEGLSHLLTQRDVLEQYTQKDMEALSEEEQYNIVAAIKEQWEKEFEAHGIERLRAIDMTLRTKGASKKKK